MKTLITIFAFVSLVTQTTFARNWDRVEIPGAVCGDGLPYSIFVNKKADSKNLLVEFMGGGACWDFGTCFGVDLSGIKLRTWMHPLPEVPFYSYLTSDMMFWNDHPFKDDSAIYLPYCTGDVFAADHVADYSGFKTYHQGYRNIVATFQYLAQKNILKFSEVERLTAFGASAGAIGALVHLKNIEPYFPRAKKIAIIDSAGLHFGPTFWNKFTPRLVGDFTQAFASAGLTLNPNDGFVAQYMGPVFANLKQWNIGIMQATRDQVMSTVFGEISPEEHRRLVLSDRGIVAVAKNYPNTSVWISDSDMHTFMLLRSTSHKEDMENESAINFVNSVVESSILLK